MLKQNVKYDFIKIITGSDLSSRKLAVMKAESKNPGPTLWLTACIHGDEVGGVAVIQEVFKWLKRNPLKCGTIFAFPLMNPVGFETGSRYFSPSGEDLNRSFPGSDNGSVAERIADKIFTTITKTKPTLVLDLHNDWIRSIPYTLIDPPPAKHRDTYEFTKKIAHQAGFLLINEQEDAEDAIELKKSLSGSLFQKGIPALTLELGSSYIIDEQNIDDGAEAVINIMSALEMIEKIDKKIDESPLAPLKTKILKYSHLPLSSTSGLVRFLAKPGEIVKAGQPVARIYNVFGKPQETIIATADGVVLSNTDLAVSFPGTPIMSFGLI